MIGKKGKVMIVCYVVFLAVLFLMCSTDLIIREPEQEIYQIAVIIEDVRDDNYGNFRKGMDQAAVELNADVRFITLYEKLESGQQLEFIVREQQDGADALIVAPVEERKLFDALIQKQITTPMVLLGSGLTGEEIIGTITVDYHGMGRHLTQQMLQKTPEGTSVVILSESGNSSLAGKSFLEGIREELDKNGRDYQTIGRGKETDIKEILEKVTELGKAQVVILAESPEILMETAAAGAEQPLFMEHIRGLYGRGSAIPILNYLDRGLITGLCVTDEFSTGYYSVCMAVRELEGLEESEDLKMDYYYIEKEDLRETVYEKMLFPIE